MSWILNTRGMDPTLVAGIFFIFTSYAVHPMVESAYHRVKAYFAWRALEKRQTVEVTNYPMLAEMLGARGTWDAGWVTTTLLALFSFVCWGLELSVEFAHIEGLAYLLHQPPPVEVGVKDGLDVWLVSWPCVIIFLQCSPSQLTRAVDALLQRNCPPPCRR